MSGQVLSEVNIAATSGGYWPMNPVPVATVRSIPTPSWSARIHWPQPLLSCDCGAGP